MSNLLKRTLALALIFCLVLSVIPAVSADEPAEDKLTEAIVYNFTSPTGNLRKSSSNSEPADAYKEAAAKEAGRNWWVFHVGEQWKSPTVGGDGIVVDPQGNGLKTRTIALGITVEKDGLYDLFVGTKSANNLGFSIIKLNDTTKTKLANGLAYTATSTTGSRLWSCLSTYIGCADEVFNTEIETAHGRKPGYYHIESYLGQVQLTAGDYAVIPYNTVEDTNIVIRDLIMSYAGDGLALNTAAVKTKLGAAATIVLQDDYYAPGTDMIGQDGHAVNLNGHTMTVGTVTNACVVDFSAAGTGLLVADRVAFYDKENSCYNYPVNKSDKVKIGQIGLYSAAKGGYVFSGNTPSVATQSNTAYTNPLYNAENNTVQFAAKFIIEDDVRQLIAAGGSGFRMQMLWQVGGEEPVTSILSNETVRKWAADSSDQVLQITLKGVDTLEAGTVIKCYPRVWANGTYYYGATLSFTVPAA